MPGIPNRAALINEELLEFPMTGPFGGVQSELSPDLVEQYGFLDALNIILRRGRADVRPGYTSLGPLPDPAVEPIVGIADFFTSETERKQTILTPTRLLKYATSTGWEDVSGTLTGGNSDLFNWTVVNSKLLFSQGVDPVQLWDGITPDFAAASPDAVPARSLMELNTHLIVADTIESGIRFSQRVRWTGAGDPTDWTSFSAGMVDILNNLGPIRGLCKLFQTGYAMHQLGDYSNRSNGNASGVSFHPINIQSQRNDLSPLTCDLRRRTCRLRRER
jgi:hypothetical protein